MAAKGEFFKVRVGVVVIRDSQLLLARQNGRPFWVLPGGTLEVGETMEQCAIRELQEETNLTITIDKLLYVADFIPADKHVIDVVFLGRYISGDLVPEENSNIDDIGFFSLNEVTQMQTAPKEVFESLLTEVSLGFPAQGVYLGKYGA